MCIVLYTKSAIKMKTRSATRKYIDAEDDKIRQQINDVVDTVILLRRDFELRKQHVSLFYVFCCFFFLLAMTTCLIIERRRKLVE
jgi:hypothetical protein